MHAVTPCLSPARRQELAPSRQPASEVLSEQYQCPICWDTLRSPVVLTCSHRLCWGCALAYFAANKRGPAAPEAADAKKQGQVVQEQAAAAASGTTVVEAAQQAQQEQQEQAEDAQSVCTTFDCPVCRKAQLLDLERLHVDPHLDAFLQRLERQQQRSGGGVLLPGAAAASSGDGAAAASTQPIPIAAASGAAAAAAAAATAADGVEAMVLDPQPTSAARLAEASDSLAQAAAAEQQQQRRERAAAGSGAEVILEVPAAELGEPALLPPQRPEHRGRLVVCLVSGWVGVERVPPAAHAPCLAAAGLPLAAALLAPPPPTTTSPRCSPPHPPSFRAWTRTWMALWCPPSPPSARRCCPRAWVRLGRGGVVGLGSLPCSAVLSPSRAGLAQAAACPPAAPASSAWPSGPGAPPPTAASAACLPPHPRQRPALSATMPTLPPLPSGGALHGTLAPLLVP